MKRGRGDWAPYADKQAYHTTPLHPVGELISEAMKTMETHPTYVEVTEATIAKLRQRISELEDEVRYWQRQYTMK